ncbi:hypothetical protein TRIUR3_16246 [Triticum urartu]|uniref:Uncharacterized protein n=1 Tax=Triticum urartu TaxID=4572 RepID=M8AQL0_TRIUA|nr:hypothetical protein TRIUR3_16246 [Triticum urartu]
MGEGREPQSCASGSSPQRRIGNGDYSRLFKQLSNSSPMAITNHEWLLHYSCICSGG